METAEPRRWNLTPMPFTSRKSAPVCLTTSTPRPTPACCSSASPCCSPVPNIHAPPQPCCSPSCRRSDRLSIGIRRDTANNFLLKAFVLALVLLLVYHANTTCQPEQQPKSKMFERFEQQAQNNNWVVGIDQFRQQLEKENQYDLEQWSGFLGEVQRDNRLTFFRNQHGEGMLKLDL